MNMENLAILSQRSFRSGIFVQEIAAKTIINPGGMIQKTIQCNHKMSVPRLFITRKQEVG